MGNTCLIKFDYISIQKHTLHLEENLYQFLVLSGLTSKQTLNDVNI